MRVLVLFLLAFSILGCSTNTTVRLNITPKLIVPTSVEELSQSLSEDSVVENLKASKIELKITHKF